MQKGEKEAFAILEKNIIKGEKYLWFHAASLGEFEQGRPLIEEIKRNYPQYKVLQTFFSPSGYEVRKRTTKGPTSPATSLLTRLTMPDGSSNWHSLIWLFS